ncbi:FAD-dependent oxidoreductase, partial [Nonomuraea sp. NPDC004297]
CCPSGCARCTNWRRPSARRCSATVTEARVGLRPVYAPGSALIGPLTDRVVVATGLSAYGLTAGPYAGEIAAALALGERPPIDVTPYAPG